MVCEQDRSFGNRTDTPGTTYVEEGGNSAARIVAILLGGALLAALFFLVLGDGATIVNDDPAVMAPADVTLPPDETAASAVAPVAPATDILPSVLPAE